MNAITLADADVLRSASECSACRAGAGKQRPIFHKWGVPISECSQCGSASAVVPADFDPKAIYSAAYYHGGRTDGYADYSAGEAVLRREFRRCLHQLERAGVRGGKLLEIGCAYGYFLKEASPRFQGVGVEISDAARQRASAARLAVYADLMAPEVRDGAPYDGLILLDCIEHLKDPASALVKAVALLGEDAAILISTGDWGSPVARLTRRHWRLMTPPQHLSFFTRQGMEELLGSLGFEVVTLERPWRLIPLGLAMYQLTRRLGFRVAISPQLNQIVAPVNLFDCMRVVARRKQGARSQ